MRWLGVTAITMLLVGCQGAPLGRTSASVRHHQQRSTVGATRTLGRGVIQDHHQSLYYHRGRWYWIPGHVHGPGCGHVRVRGVWRLVEPSPERPLCQ